ncbi:hypothetical protein ACJX0J_006505 [Zea mays]
MPLTLYLGTRANDVAPHQGHKLKQQPTTHVILFDYIYISINGAIFSESHCPIKPGIAATQETSRQFNQGSLGLGSGVKTKSRDFKLLLIEYSLGVLFVKSIVG